MRRPRGPGGRFLTADEIAAQKVPSTDHPSPSNPVENDPENLEDDELVQAPSPVVSLDREPLIAHTPDHRSIMYSLQSHSAISHLSLPQSQPPPAKTPSNNSFPLRFKSSTNSTPVTLSSPYSPSQLHHVSHPQADTRHHNSDIDFRGLYGNTETNAVEIQRRTDEIIQFGAASGS